MKKLIYFILLTVIGSTAFSQSPSRYFNYRQAYPLAIGETTIDSTIYSNYGLYMHDIILDTLPHYEIGYIMNQTVHYFEDGIGFYVKADSLHSSNVTYSYEVDTPPVGSFEFNENTGRFKFYPDASDYRSFIVTFTAATGLNSISQDVEFDLMPTVVPECCVLQSDGEMPSAQDYTILASSSMQMQLNNSNRTAYSYSISGKDIVFDNNIHNKVWGLSGREDIYELNLYAERLYICSALEFPHTNVTIYAKELIFNDNDSVVSSINTTPINPDILTNGDGINGENAGNIVLNIKELSADMAKRFIANGAKGQCSNRNGNPGNGGNGGTVSSTVDVSGYCDLVRGSAGVKYDVDSTEYKHTGVIIGAGNQGEAGTFEIINEKYSWLHPYYMSAVVRHVNDTYLNNYFDYTKKTCSDYHEIFESFMQSEEWNNYDEILKVELRDQMLEIESILFRINEDLDYFGNPLGWAPMLSFEVMMANYQNEINRAMPTLYLYHWINRIDHNLEELSAASQVAASQVESDIEENKNTINTLVADIPVIEDQITELIADINNLEVRMTFLKNQLLEKAKHNVKKRNRINKIFGIAKSVLNVVPLLGPVGATISTVGNLALNYASDYFGVSDSYGYGNAISGVVNFDYSKALETMQSAIDSIDMSTLGQTASTLNTAYSTITNTINPLINSISNLHNVLSMSSTPSNEVEAELQKLLSESPEYAAMTSEFNELNHKKEEFQEKLNNTFVNITNTACEVSNNIISLDALRRDVFEGNSKRDLEAMQCVEKMQQRAKNRLLKYHYYMRRAYEYRLLKPYNGQFNLVSMFERLEELGTSFDDIINPEAYESLSAIFMEEISGIVDDVLNEYTVNSPELTAPITIVLPKEKLDILNDGGVFVLNLYELGIFSPDEENVRIVNFGVHHIETHTVGNMGYSGYMDVDMEHRGISRFRKNGEIYWFNHLSRSTTNPHTWGIRYDAISNETTDIAPSYASESLLNAILGNESNIMLFSRPSAWSDIYVSKNVHTSGGGDIMIDSLVLRLQYDYTRRPNGIRNIDISTNNGLQPYITCSEVDRNGRSNGLGNFHRSYTNSNGIVTFDAIEKFGTYYFVNWTDRIGNVVSSTNELTVTKSTDQFYMANYERRVPVLDVVDTIYVGCNAGEYEVLVRNSGSGDIEMDWHLSDEHSTWVHLNSIVDGIDDGYFSFSYDSFNNNGVRVDSIEIFAPETDIILKQIYIIQHDNTYKKICADINPLGAGIVEGTGYYEINDTVNLSAIAIDNCEFVSWEKNGQIMSTQPDYTFIVTDDTHFTANFSCENMVSVSAEVYPANSGYVIGTGLYNKNEIVTLKAIPLNNFTFDNWENDNIVVSNVEELKFIAVKDVHYVAKFKNEFDVDENNEYNLKIYPNPFTNSVYVECDEMEYIQVFSSLGEEKRNINTVGNTSATIDMNNLPSGMYFIKVKNRNATYLKKVIKM